MNHPQYIITPDGIGFTLPDDPIFEVITIREAQEGDNLELLSVGYAVIIRAKKWQQIQTISPIFRFNNYPVDEFTKLEDQPIIAKTDAITWLEDFLIHLSAAKQPTVLHCSSDGEIFTN